MGSYECFGSVLGGRRARHQEAPPESPGFSHRNISKRFSSSLKQRKLGPSHLTQIQGDIHLVVDQTPGEGGALPPPLGPIDGVAHRVGVAGVFGVAVAAVLTLNSRFVGIYRHSCTDS